MIRRADAEFIHRLFIRAPNGFWSHADHPEPMTPTGVARGAGHQVPLVSSGVWMVVCACGLGQLACPEFPRFFCLGCLNADVDHRWIEVRWPSPAECTAVETVLNARPNPETRRWMPGESIGYLVVENHLNIPNAVDVDAGKVKGDPGLAWHGVIPGVTNMLGARALPELMAG